MLESGDGVGPFGPKGRGAVGQLRGPGIASAVYDAVGVRIRDLPITAEKVSRP